MSELGLGAPWWKRLLGVRHRRQVRDLWTDETAEIDGVLRRDVPAHGAVMVRIR
jgi:hypothetical protein